MCPPTGGFIPDVARVKIIKRRPNGEDSAHMTMDALDINVDPQALRRVLDGRWAQVRDEARETMRDPVFAPRDDLSFHEQRDHIFEQLKAIAKTNGPKLLFPRAYGGLDEVGGAISGFETQAFGDLSLLVKGGVQWGLFGGTVRHLGTKRHHDRYLESIMTVDLPGCFAMTETGHGSDVQALRTTATYDPETDEFVICTPDDDARKDYIGNAAQHGRMAAVFAQLITGEECHGVHAFLVPLRNDSGDVLPGVHIEDDGVKAGLNGVDNGRIAFDNVRIPRDNLLDRFGSVDANGAYSSPIDNINKRFFTMLGALVQGRISISGAAVSAGKKALTIAVRYGERRRQFKAPGGDSEIAILDYLAHQRVLLPALAKTYALSFAQTDLVAELHEVQTDRPDDDEARRKLETHAAALKAISTWHATRTIQDCREACGGAGYLAVNQLVELKADTDVFTTFEGDNTVLLQLVAKTLLTNYQAEFGELDTLHTVRFVAEQVAEVVIERIGARSLVQRLVDAIPGTDEDTNLLDRDYQMSLLAWREKHALEGVARRLRKGFEADADPFDVFNGTQDHLLLAARAHIDARILEAFTDAIDTLEDSDTKTLLSRVADLHALHTIETERAWFLEHNRITQTRSKAITAAVNALCQQLRPFARVLVDAFGIPEELITAPIAQV
jgi:acyl-CoA oxidase